MPLLEAVEHAALRDGVPVDARIESGRTPIHALQRLWDAERFDRIVVPAPAGRGPGFTPKDLTWMLDARAERDADPPADPGGRGGARYAAVAQRQPSGPGELRARRRILVSSRPSQA